MVVQNGASANNTGATPTVADTFAALSSSASVPTSTAVKNDLAGATTATPVVNTSDSASAERNESSTTTDASAATNSTSGAPNKQEDGTKDETTKAPRDWATIQSEYAKTDEKIAKRLARYSSPEAVLDALIAAQNKIASGQLKTALPESHTPEELAAWRSANGIPDSVDGYEINIPESYILTENGQEFANGLLQAAHDANIHPQAVQKLFDSIIRQQQAADKAEAEAEELSLVKAKQQLMEEWTGSDYILNSNMVNNLLDTAPEGIKDQLLKGRMEDGSPIGHNVHLMRWLANLAREINPVATVVPGSGESASATIQTELRSLEQMMGDPESRYNKGSDAKKLQQRYIDLVEAQVKYKKRV